jgi:hypothetical protein
VRPVDTPTRYIDLVPQDGSSLGSGGFKAGSSGQTFPKKVRFKLGGAKPNAVIVESRVNSFNFADYIGTEFVSQIRLDVLASTTNSLKISDPIHPFGGFDG